MAYFLSPLITSELPGLWMEGAPYKKENIYKIEKDKLPPINYDVHTFKPHSLPHLETPKHTSNEGKTLDFYWENCKSYFYGPCVVIKLKGDKYLPNERVPNHYHWEVTRQELQTAIYNCTGSEVVPAKIFLTTELYPLTKDGYHDPNYVLTLSLEAADWLVQQSQFHLYGTSWKSSDFNPGKVERPIHNKLFTKALILECLALNHVPQGKYFYAGAPIPLMGASESCISPILLESHELFI